MKNIFFLISFVFLLVSCNRDESLDPRPVFIDGNYVRLDITSKFLNFEDSSTLFGGYLSAPGKNVSKFNLYVRKSDLAGNSFEDFKLLTTVTTFPFDLKISTDQIATALGVTSSQLLLNEEFRFYGESFDLKGNRADYSNLSSTIRSNLAYYKPAYRFRTSIKNSLIVNNPLEQEAYDSYTPQ